MESAQFSFEKTTEWEKARTVRAERQNFHAQWQFILKKMIAPIRWNMKMWTRYNVAQPAIEKMIKHFEDDWQLSD
jgi:hypothetical protein